MGSASCDISNLVELSDTDIINEQTDQRFLAVMRCYEACVTRLTLC